MKRKSIAFLVYKHIHIPHNLREFYLSKELTNRNWEVKWLLPRSGSNDVLSVDWPIETYPDFDIFGHKFILPIYLALKLKKSKVKILWVSGWAQRDTSALYWLIRIIKFVGMKIVYDPIDPIDELFEAEQPNETHKYSIIYARLNKIYELCNIIFTVTPQKKDLLIKRGISKNKIVIARWGTDISIFNKDNILIDYKKKIGIDRDIFLAGWLGSMNHFKGIEEIFIPLVERIANNNKNIHFIIAGYGLLKEQINQWVANNKSLPVTLLDRINYEETPSFTASLDAYIVSTNPESQFGKTICPVKCFDAIAMGVDLLVTKTDATKFLEEISNNVHLCEFSIESFEKNLIRLLANRKQATNYPSEDNTFPFSHQNVSIDIANSLENLVF